uniref:Metalloendopeptidase n=1 Tax=Durusdinium trenchii TaxID=1381693 RepID=A0ABP0N8Y6_9DINO
MNFLRQAVALVLTVRLVDSQDFLAPLAPAEGWGEPGSTVVHHVYHVEHTPSWVHTPTVVHVPGVSGSSFDSSTFDSLSGAPTFPESFSGSTFAHGLSGASAFPDLAGSPSYADSFSGSGLSYVPSQSTADAVATHGAGETPEETSERIHKMVERMSKYVASKSPDPATVQMAQRMELSARNGMLREEGYDNIATILSKASMLSSPSAPVFETAATKGFLATREDLDWLLNHCGEAAVAGEKNMEETTAGGDTPCPAGQACSPTKSYGAGTPWTNSEVKYCFDVQLAPSAKSAVECAITKIRQAVPGITFTNVGQRGSGSCNSRPAIFVQSQNSGCWANIGMTGSFSGFFTGNQQLNLQTPGCNDCGTAIHEMLHSMGMAHEQSRPDRDNYVTINWQNIQSNMHSQFAKDSYADTNRPYDILSIMHYGPTAFTSNGMPSITVKPAGFALYTQDPNRYQYYRTGQRMGMSERDIGQLKDLYQCTTPSTCMGSNMVVVTSQPSSAVRPPSPVGPIGPNWPDMGGFGNMLQGDSLVQLVVAAVVIIVLCSALSCLCSRGGGYIRI